MYDKLFNFSLYLETMHRSGMTRRMKFLDGVVAWSPGSPSGVIQLAPVLRIQIARHSGYVVLPAEVPSQEIEASLGSGRSLWPPWSSLGSYVVADMTYSWKSRESGWTVKLWGHLPCRLTRWLSYWFRAMLIPKPIKLKTLINKMKSSIYYFYSFNLQCLLYWTFVKGKKLNANNLYQVRIHVC